MVPAPKGTTMSRYVLLAHDRTLRVTVGWDPPLQTFFGQVVRPATAPYADDTLVVWIGTRAQEIASVAQLCRQLAAYAAIPRATQARLAREQRASRSPTALQVRLRQALEQLEPPRDQRRG
jgi:hypothetical protein